VCVGLLVWRELVLARVHVMSKAATLCLCFTCARRFSVVEQGGLYGVPSPGGVREVPPADWHSDGEHSDGGVEHSGPGRPSGAAAAAAGGSGRLSNL
jgi:hypothetical protein